MNRTPFPYRDFEMVKTSIETALTRDEEIYALITGDTGTGKTALLRQLRSQLDRTHFRVLYFSEARRLGASGLVKVLGETLRIRSSLCHAVALDRVLRALADEPQHLLIWLDEAHELPEETLSEARALAESDLDGYRKVHILFSGMPKLRAQLQALPHLWRRIAVREELTGLIFEETLDFLEHHFPSQPMRLCDAGLVALFERARGAPGLILPMYRSILRRAGDGKEKIGAELVDETLERWDLC